MDFLSKLDAAIAKNNSLLCVGLDPDSAKLPPSIADGAQDYFEFCKAIIDTTHDLVCAYKPNSAFFEGLGAKGTEELKLVCDYIRSHYPDIPIILDFKRGDIGNTNQHYASYAFSYLGADAITIQPYQGQAAVQPFLDYKDKGIIVLCKTSNDGSGEFQNLEIGDKKLYQVVAQNVSNNWNTNGNCLLVVGATYPDELKEIRSIVGEMPLLIPGIGAQGGDIEATVKAGLNSDAKGLIINSARAILYASAGDDFAELARNAAEQTRDEINKYRSA